MCQRRVLGMVHTPDRSVQVMGEPSHSHHQTALCFWLPGSSPGSINLPGFPFTVADWVRWLLGVSCLGSIFPKLPLSCWALLSSWGNSPHCVVWLLILGISSVFEAGGSLTKPVLSSELERVGCLQSSWRCCLGLVECPSFPLGSWPWPVTWDALHYPILNACRDLCLVPSAYGAGQ